MNTRIKNNSVLVAAVLILAGAFGTVNAQDSVLAVSNPAVNRGGLSCTNGGAAVLSQAPNQSNGIFADGDCGLCGTGQQSVAENFSLSTATTIAQITIWSGYFSGDMFPTPPDPWTITIHNDAASLPGTVVTSETVTPTGTLTGVVLFGVQEIEYVFDITPVNLPAGNYWVEITTNSVGNADQAFWEIGNADTVGNGIDGTVFATAVPGVTWMFTAGQDFAVLMCGPGDADVSLAITNDATPPVADGGSFNFILTASNAGPGTASNAMVNATISNNATVNSTDCGAGIAGNNITWAAGNIAPAGNAVCNVNVTVNGVGNITASGSVSSDISDPVPANNNGSNAVAGPVQTIPTLSFAGMVAMVLAMFAGLFMYQRRQRQN